MTTVFCPLQGREHRLDIFGESSSEKIGMKLWPSAVALAMNIPEGEGRRVLELGCGLGLVSMMLRLQGWEVTATDGDDEVLMQAMENAKRNKIDGIDFRKLEWGSDEVLGVYDRVYASDVLYDPENHIPLINCIKRHLSFEGFARIIDPGREEADGFPFSAASDGFEVWLSVFPEGGRMVEYTLERSLQFSPPRYTPEYTDSLLKDYRRLQQAVREARGQLLDAYQNILKQFDEEAA